LENAFFLGMLRYPCGSRIRSGFYEKELVSVNDSKVRTVEYSKFAQQLNKAAGGKVTAYLDKENGCELFLGSDNRIFVPLEIIQYQCSAALAFLRDCINNDGARGRFILSELDDGGFELEAVKDT